MPQRNMGASAANRETPLTVTDPPNIDPSRRARKLDVAVIPVAVSQITSEALLGIPSRRYREWVLARHLPHSRLGKLVIVDLQVALAEIRRETETEDEQQPTNEVNRLRKAAGLKVSG